VRAVYCSIDPATAILEVAVHTGFPVLDTVAHVLTAVNIAKLSSIHVVDPAYGGIRQAIATRCHRCVLCYKFLMNARSKYWEDIFWRDNGHCRYCAVDLTSTINHWASATVDHVIAVVAGGSDEMDNLVLSCNLCNNILSRASKLTTFEARKARVLEKRPDYESRYQFYVRKE
jgi:5-methylcytosine-specific restriction endonuclease McrA